MSYLRQMVTQVAIKASKGEQWAVDFIANRYEGKPGQAPKRTASIEDVEQSIDEVETAALNAIAKAAEEKTNSTNTTNSTGTGNPSEGNETTD